MDNQKRPVRRREGKKPGVSDFLPFAAFYLPGYCVVKIWKPL